MAPGFFTLFRKNWKKSSFFLITSNVALWYTYDYTVTNDVMKTSCRRAASLGDMKLKSPLGHPRHITVILNPVAGKRKSKKLYTKWVEPILHLAGIKVSLIETESPNQAYDLMKIMSDCDGVAIVGGDGTVHEAINGLLHRPDNLEAVNKFPIGIMPTGQYNSIARYLHQNINYRNQKEFLINATMSLVDSCTQRHDVLKINPIEAKHDNDLPIYALRDVRYGKYQDNFIKTSGYLFYQTNIRPIWLRIQRLLSNKYPNPKIESISYTEPCAGCLRCFEKHKLKERQPIEIEQKSANRRWWGILAPIPKTNTGPSEEELRELELSKRDNPECDRWIKVGQISEVTDFRACMMGDKKVRLSLGREGEYTPSEIIETQDVRLRVAEEIDNEKKVSDEKKQLIKVETNIENSDNTATEDNNKEIESVKKEEEKDQSTKFLIDGQPIQAHSVEISTISKPLTIFTGPIKIVPIQ